jgi:hypothetical protein
LDCGENFLLEEKFEDVSPSSATVPEIPFDHPMRSAIAIMDALHKYLNHPDHPRHPE